MVQVKYIMLISNIMLRIESNQFCFMVWTWTNIVTNDLDPAHKKVNIKSEHKKANGNGICHEIH